MWRKIFIGLVALALFTALPGLAEAGSTCPHSAAANLKKSATVTQAGERLAALVCSGHAEGAGLPAPAPPMNAPHCGGGPPACCPALVVLPYPPALPFPQPALTGWPIAVVLFIPQSDLKSLFHPPENV